LNIQEPIEFHFSEFDEYIRQGEPDQREKASIWSMAIGLQQVDQLQVSEYLKQTAAEHIEGKITQDEVEKRINAYYQMEESRKEETGTDEADKVAARIVRVMNSQTFTFSPSHYASIHRSLFSGILPHAGTYRDYDISKKEWVLNNASVLYGAADYISDTLRYDFSEEEKYAYKNKSTEEVIHHLSEFIAGIWQIHPFREGNTRTTAVFLVQYLRSLGYSANNDLFAAHSWYFRNALVRANYDNVPKGITRTTEFLELFLRNVLLHEQNELKNRYLHILWTGERPHLTTENVTKNVTKKISQQVTEILKEHKDTQLTDRQEDVLKEILLNPCISAAEMSLKMSPKMSPKKVLSERTIKRDLKALQDAGIIRHIGPSNGGNWEVIRGER